MKEKHGMTNTPEYRSWAMMLSRCRSQTNPMWPYYGGRGISVCAEWESFSGFYRDMGPRPEGATIDRIDVDGDYTPENCRWAFSSEQAQNKRKINGKNRFTGAQKALGKWRAYINKDKKQIALGVHENEEEAAIVYDVYAYVLYPGGKLNFPNYSDVYQWIFENVSITREELVNSSVSAAQGLKWLAVSRIKKTRGA